MRIERSESRSQEEPYAKTAAPPPIEAADAERGEDGDADDHAPAAAAAAGCAHARRFRAMEQLQVDGRAPAPRRAHVRMLAVMRRGSTAAAGSSAGARPADGMPRVEAARQRPAYARAARRLARLRPRAGRARLRVAARRRRDAGGHRLPLLVVDRGARPVRDHARDPAAHRARPAASARRSRCARRRRGRSALGLAVLALLGDLGRERRHSRRSSTRPRSRGSCLTTGTRAARVRSRRSSSSSRSSPRPSRS